jgi:universal stress protein E
MPILAAVDFSDNSRRALRKAAQLARAQQAELVVLHCVESADQDAFWRHLVGTPWEVPAKVRRVAKHRLVEWVHETLDTADTPEQITHEVALKNTADGIEAAVRKHGVERVVLGATGAGKLGALLLGRTAEKVIRASSVPVLAVSPDAPIGPFETILAPVDFSERSRISLGTAIETARDDNARLLILHAYALPAAGLALLDMQPPPEVIEAYEEQKKAELEEFVDTFDVEGVEVETLLGLDSPPSAIARTAAQRDVSLICMGTHGERGFRRLLLGSTTARVLRQMPCSVLTVPRPLQN